MSKCVYKKGGSKKYVLTKSFVAKLKVKPPVNIHTEYCSYLRTGYICIYEGYEWDGPSGPTIDTDNFMDGALIHDVMYQLMREKHLALRPYRLYADNELYRQCRASGMGWIRASYVWAGVRIGGHKAAGGGYE